MYSQILASLGILSTLFSNLFQINTTLRTKIVEDFNFSALFLRILSIILWLIYSFATTNIFLITGNLISFLSVSIILFYKIRHITPDEKWQA